MLYTCNKYNTVCQLYFNETSETLLRIFRPREAEKLSEKQKERVSLLEKYVYLALKTRWRKAETLTNISRKGWIPPFKEDWDKYG